MEIKTNQDIANDTIYEKKSFEKTIYMEPLEDDEYVNIKDVRKALNEFFEWQKECLNHSITIEEKAMEIFGEELLR